MSNLWLFSVSCPFSLSLSPNLSILCTCVWPTAQLSVWLFLLLLTWEEGRCVCLIEKEKNRYTPFSSPCSLPLLPFALWLLLGECLRLYLSCPGAGGVGGCTDCHIAMSGSDKYIFIFWQWPTLSSGEKEAHLWYVWKSVTWHRGDEILFVHVECEMRFGKISVLLKPLSSHQSWLTPNINIIHWYRYLLILNSRKQFLKCNGALQSHVHIVKSFEAILSFVLNTAVLLLNSYCKQKFIQICECNVLGCMQEAVNPAFSLSGDLCPAVLLDSSVGVSTRMCEYSCHTVSLSIAQLSAQSASP